MHVYFRWNLCCKSKKGPKHGYFNITFIAEPRVIVFLTEVDFSNILNRLFFFRWKLQRHFQILRSHRFLQHVPQRQVQTTMLLVVHMIFPHFLPCRKYWLFYTIVELQTNFPSWSQLITEEEKIIISF